MEFIKKYRNQITALLQLLFCFTGIVLALRKQEQKGKKQKKKS